MQNIKWLHIHTVQINEDNTFSMRILINPSRVFRWNLVIRCTSGSSWCKIRIKELLKILSVVIEDHFILITHLENPTCEDATQKHLVQRFYFLIREKIQGIDFHTHKCSQSTHWSTQGHHTCIFTNSCFLFFCVFVIMNFYVSFLVFSPFESHCKAGS